MAGAGIESGVELDVFAKEPPQHLLDVHDDVADVEEAGLEELAAAEREELPGQGRCPRRRLTDDVDVTAPRVTRAHGREEELRAAGDNREEVVEVVGDSARQLPDRLDLLCLDQLVLRA